MGVLKRVSGIFQAKTNKLLDRAEDPRDTLDMTYEKQLEQIQQMRRGLAELATARKRIELQAAQLQQTANKLQDQAKQALAQDREDLAREALTRRAAIGEQLADLQTQHEQVATQEQGLVAKVQTAQSRVEAFRTQKETLKASYTAAQAQTKIGEAMSGISDSMGDAGMAMQRAQDKIAGMQARAAAIDELMASGALTDLGSSPTDDIQAQLNQLSAGSQVDLEMARLRGELATPAAAQLPAGEADEPPSVDAELVDPAATGNAPASSDAGAATAGAVPEASPSTEGLATGGSA